MDEFLRRLLDGYYYLKENYTFLEDAYYKASKKNEEYLEKISQLESQLGNKIEPARGVAADQTNLSQLEMEVI